MTHRRSACPKCGGMKSILAKTCKPCSSDRGAFKHGLSYKPEYRVWQTMRQRCTVPTNPAYEDYGARGITVCAGWLDSPATFVADMGPRPAGHEIDRRHNNGGYWCGKCEECIRLGRPANCRWATRSENDRNRRSNYLVDYQGEKRVLAEIAAAFGIPPDTLKHRLEGGWEVERALTTPVRKKAKSQSRAA